MLRKYVSVLLVNAGTGHSFRILVEIRKWLLGLKFLWVMGGGDQSQDCPLVIGIAKCIVYLLFLHGGS
jgi:hypothetical protein